MNEPLNITNTNHLFFCLFFNNGFTSYLACKLDTGLRTKLQRNTSHRLSNVLQIHETGIVMISTSEFKTGIMYKNIISIIIKQDTVIQLLVQEGMNYDSLKLLLLPTSLPVSS